MKKLSAALAVAFVLLLANTLGASAHIYYFYGGDHDYGKLGYEQVILTEAQDLHTDGHCTYVTVKHDGRYFWGAYSCGARVKLKQSVQNYDYTTYFWGCVTGHWQCGYLGKLSCFSCGTA